jgi:hypothetical protein
MSGQPVDVYICWECKKMFVVADGVEPHCCSVCGSETWDWSHEAILILPETTNTERCETNGKTETFTGAAEKDLGAGEGA